MPGPNAEFIPPARPVIGEAEIEAAVRVLRSGMVVQGPEVAAFEEEFARRWSPAGTASRSTPAPRRCSSTLMALGLRPGRRGHRAVVLLRGDRQRRRGWSAPTPVFVDIEPGSFCLDPAAVAAAITAAHRGDHAGAPLRPPGRDGPDHGDRRRSTASPSSRTPPRPTAPALHGTPVGAFGTAGCFSFYPTKNMHSLEGGMITTADAGAGADPAAAAQPGHGAAVRQRDRRRQHADDRRGRGHRPGAARQLADWTEQRRANAEVPRLAAITGVVTPPVADGARHVYHQYTVRVQGDRDAAQQRLTELGIGNAVYYPTPIHRLKPYLDRGRHARPVGAAGDRAGRRRGGLAAGAPVAEPRPTWSGSPTRRERSPGVPDERRQALRAGLIGLGAMGRNHARVLVRPGRRGAGRASSTRPVTRPARLRAPGGRRR